MTDTKHYVYSARTTKEGLALLNKAKGDMSWDQFLNAAMAKQYDLDLSIIGLPPSEHLAQAAAKRALKAQEKADKVAKRAADTKAKADKKAADAKSAKEAKTAKDKADKKAAKDKADEGKADKAAKKADARKATTLVTVNPGETVDTGAERITALAENTHPVQVPATKPAKKTKKS